jgi:sugar lactone lactonase YvrE
MGFEKTVNLRYISFMKGIQHLRDWIVLSFALLSLHGNGQELSLRPELFKAYSFKTIGGMSGNFGHTDGVGTNALFGGTTCLASDKAGNLYIVDAGLGGQTIRKMTLDGVVTTLAGKSGDAAEVDGTGSAARFFQPHGVTTDEIGNLYVADSFGQTIRKVTREGVVTTLAGRALSEGSVDGIGANARFRGPTSVTLDKAGNLYVADQLNYTIRKVTARGEVTTIAGMPLVRGTNDGVGSAARFSYPRALTMGTDGNIYVADLGGGSIRRVTPQGVVSTLAADFGLLTGIASDSSGNLYVVDSYRYVVNKVTPQGVISTLMKDDGEPVRFKFGADHSTIAIDKDDNIYVADAGDRTILKASPPANLIKVIHSLTGTDPFLGRIAISEASTDLTEWLPIQTNVVSAGWPMLILETNVPNFQYRFFRGLLL